MLLDNTPEWHRTLLLNFIYFIKVPYIFTNFAFINKFLDVPSTADKSNTQAIQIKSSHKTRKPIRLEISIEKFNELLKHKQICAADIRCLDTASKRSLTKLCLQNCLARSDS